MEKGSSRQSSWVAGAVIAGAAFIAVMAFVVYAMTGADLCLWCVDTR